jgi:hypothetical protein
VRLYLWKPDLYRVLCASPAYTWIIINSGGMVLTGETRRTRNETCPTATLFITNATWTYPDENQGLRNEKPVTNGLNYGTSNKIRWSDVRDNETWSTWLSQICSSKWVCRVIRLGEKVVYDGLLRDIIGLTCFEAALISPSNLYDMFKKGWTQTYTTLRSKCSTNRLWFDKHTLAI